MLHWKSQCVVVNLNSCYCYSECVGCTGSRELRCLCTDSVCVSWLRCSADLRSTRLICIQWPVCNVSEITFTFRWQSFSHLGVVTVWIVFQSQEALCLGTFNPDQSLQLLNHSNHSTIVQTESFVLPAVSTAKALACRDYFCLCL